MPAVDAGFSGRWRAIKAGFTRALSRRGVPLVRNRRGDYDLWQRRFWEHLIRDNEDFARDIIRMALVIDPRVREAGRNWRRGGSVALAGRFGD